MGQISERLRSLKDRLGGRRAVERDEDAVARALRKQAVAAQRLENERATENYFGPVGPPGP